MQENIGAIPLLPNHLEPLKRLLEDILKKKTPLTHLHGTITTRGTSVFVTGFDGAVDELTLYVSFHGQTSEKSKWLQNKHMYPYPCEEAAKNGLKTLDDIIRKKILVIAAPPRGSKTAIVTIFFITGVTKIMCEELHKMGYPEPTHTEYWLLSIKE